jgi:hypothetical protein
VAYGDGVTPAERYEELRDEWLCRPGVDERKMLHAPGLAAVNAKVFAFMRAGRLILKLPRDRIDELITAGDAIRMRSGTREMKEWADLEPSADWHGLSVEAHAFVLSR